MDPRRTLLFLATIVCGLGALTELPLRWFFRGGFALGCVAAGAAYLWGGGWRRAGWFFCQLLLWCEVATLTIRFLRANAFPYFTWDPAVFQIMWDRRVVVITHIAAGITALLLGPAQFWPEWRTRALTFHRWTGRVYVLAVAVGAPAALYLSGFVAPYEGGRITGASMGLLALVWLGATVTGWRKAVARQFTAHREWMFRSYLLTLVFVTLRWQISLPWLTRLGPFERVVPIFVWCSWLIPLALAEVAIRRARRADELRFV